MRLKQLSMAIAAASLLFGCSAGKDCECYPDAFIAAYIPYEVGQTQYFVSDIDTMTLTATKVVIPDNYRTASNPLFNKGEQACWMTAIAEFSCSDTTIVGFKLIIDEVDGEISGYYCEIEEIYPVRPSNLVYGGNLNRHDDTIQLLSLNNNHTEGNFSRVDIKNGSGISAIYDKRGTENTERIWRLIETP